MKFRVGQIEQRRERMRRGWEREMETDRVRAYGRKPVILY